MTFRDLAAGLLLGLAASAAAAQDASTLSAEELTDLFESQRTRGLVLAPTGDEATLPTDAATGTTVAGATEDYTTLAPEQQINIQIAFAFDSAALEPSEASKLGNLCTAMAASDIPLFRIVGHTDASGSDDYNQRLSLLRAEEVVRYLTTECGIAAERLQAVGVGEAYPFDAADPRADANRRVEFQVGA